MSDVEMVELNTAAQIQEIKDTLTAISEEIAFIKSTMVNADNTISKVAEQVMPTLNELMQSPMLKMLGVGKKK